MTPTNELSDIKTQFYALMENYPTVYANYKVNPDLPSAAADYNKLEANVTSLHNRMFAFQSGMEKELDEREATVNELTSKNAKLNAILAKQSSSLDGKNALITVEPFTTISGLAQLPGCNADKTNCPCVDENGSCPVSCKNKNLCTATPNQISMVAQVKSIEKTSYVYSLMRIMYLLLGIALISYFIYKMVGPASSADSSATATATATTPSLAPSSMQQPV
jgi:hypothetical protein